MRCATLILIFCSTAHAGFIVNTGTPTGTVGSSFVSPWYATREGRESRAQSKLAGMFSLSEKSTITDVEAYISSLNRDANGDVAPTGGEVVASIYSDSARDGSNTPRSRLFSSAFNIPSGDPGGWYGASGLDWVLQPGGYWVVVELEADSTFSGGLSRGATNPHLALEAFYNDGIGWRIDNNVDHGWRIQGTPAVDIPRVPEPSSLLLVWTLLAALHFHRSVFRHILPGPRCTVG